MSSPVGCPACGAYDDHEVVARPSAESDAVADSLPDALLQCTACSAEFEAYHAIEPEAFYCVRCRQFSATGTPVNTGHSTTGDTGCPNCHEADPFRPVKLAEDHVEGFNGGHLTDPEAAVVVADAVEHAAGSDLALSMHAVADAAVAAREHVEKATGSGALTDREERRARRAVETLRDVAEDVDERLADSDEVNL
ncbi:putative protein 41 [Haloarcula hispanica icosahedral virus 2]|uniref:Uncharacterized protein n=1 Tax=Haloarcula hispanica icosahedral virus 2 TaxID=1154689 RepID=H9AZZ7_9VIRU|nr:putative protein 41 [Haloarcula hispanica icosahedral virus 2]AFD02322.1 putative protein 41 [Haloarcula hispanica icosahedral virus 2]